MSFLAAVPSDSESVWAIMSRYMAQTRPLFALTQEVMRASASSLSEGDRELIAAWTSLANRCDYCAGVHTSTAAAFGVDPATLEALAADIDTAPVRDAMKPVLRYAEKLTRAPSRLTQADVDAIFAAGWDENDFHCVVMVCALFNFYNRLIEGYGVHNVPDYRANHGRELAEHGYQL